MNSSFSNLLTLLAASIALLAGCKDTPSPVVDGGESDTRVCVTTDAPDRDGIDANCDDVDGDAADSIFVDGATGNDANAGTRAAPVATIGRGIALCVEHSKHAVLIAQGTYPEQVTVVDGVSLHGGYQSSNAWARAALDSPTTIVQPGASPGLVAESIAMPTRITGLRIHASPEGTGGTAIAVRLRDASAITFENDALIADPGTDGTSPSSPPAATPGSTGTVGSSSRCYGTGGGCTTSFVIMSVAGAPAPACGCGAGGYGAGSELYTAPGEGGQRFLADRVTCQRTTTTTGAPSNGAPATGGATDGLPGTGGSTGASGAAGPNTSAVTGFGADGFEASTATAGTSGLTGGGGGGGAAAGHYECTASQSLLGSGGGSGGSGGCGGAGGAGGQTGGGSIALYAWRSSPVLIATTLDARDGGDGGNGANGGGGGLGRDGGAGGPSIGCPSNSTLRSYRGGGGGRGGDGGPGGHGGHGAGGPAIAIVLGDDAVVSPLSEDYFIALGSPGHGGGQGTPDVAADGLRCAVFEATNQTCTPLE